MPLSPPDVTRDHLHTRHVTCQGFRRADGLWDIEGRITDVKTYGFRNEDRGEIVPGDPIHDMWVRLTLDDRLVVQAVEAVTDKSPYHLCGDITPNFSRLIGLRIAPGWTAQVHQRLGGVQGCTHLVELLGPVATTAFQTIYPVLARERAARRQTDGASGAETGARPPLLNTCHAFASDGPIVRRYWPDHYTGTQPEPGEV